MNQATVLHVGREIVNLIMGSPDPLAIAEAAYKAMTSASAAPTADDFRKALALPELEWLQEMFAPLLPDGRVQLRDDIKWLITTIIALLALLLVTYQGCSKNNLTAEQIRQQVSEAVQQEASQLAKKTIPPPVRKETFYINGTEEATAHPRFVTVDAADEAAAREKVEAMGIRVSKVTRSHHGL